MDEPEELSMEDEDCVERLCVVDAAEEGVERVWVDVEETLELSDDWVDMEELVIDSVELVIV